MRQWPFIITMIVMISPYSTCKGQQLSVIAPTHFIPGKTFPFVVEATSGGTTDLFHTNNLTPTVVGGQMNGVLKLKKGRAMTSVESGNGSSLSITDTDLAVYMTANQAATVVHSGLITGNETWASGTVHLIESDLTIGSNDTLTIEEGCWVMLDPVVNIMVEGHLAILGTQMDPVTLIASNNNNGWGGIVALNGSVVINYGLITEGGADVSQAYGHSGSQAVVMAMNGGIVSMDHSFIFDCFGKGIGGSDGILEFRNGGISRCDMGGEFLSSYIQFRSSHIIDIPNDDGLFVDDDNDGLYLSGASAQSSDPSVIDSCVFMFGKDDAIDHNNAILEVKNTWIEGFEHEGIAASNGNSVLVYNTLVKNCEQGIEAGYGSPTVTVDHCVLIENDYGLRFGDWYDWGCSGTITCTNSISFNNGDNIHNFDYQTNAPVADAMDITYTITNDSEYDGGTGCLNGTPSFSSAYYLNPGSIGISAGNDGLDMGLIPPLATGIGIPEQKDPGQLLYTEVYDMNGRLLSTGNRNGPFELKTGIYISVDHFEHGVITNKRLITR